MTTDEKWEYWFSPPILTELFWKKIRYRCSPGLDRIGIVSFTNNLDGNIEIISRKVLNGTYRFTKYCELLIPKGRNKKPRCVSRPTIRDKLTLCALNSYLQDIYSGEIDNRLLHTKVNEIIRNIPNYTHCVKVDLIGFYPSINHEILIQILSAKAPLPVLELIKLAIGTSSVSKEFSSKVTNIVVPNQGVPEGLSISNLLASIYLHSVDTYFSESRTLYYCRYVDDILLLTNEANVETVKSDVKRELVALKLNMHDFSEPEKSYVVDCQKGFSYLGYYYCNNKITVKCDTIDRFEHSLERMFSEYKKQENSSQKDTAHNIDMFAWKLNLKIAGCVYNARKYGWIFYYSQITDMVLLKHLDWLVERMYVRYGIQRSTIGIKSFFKTHHEIKYNLSRSIYFCNIDKMTQAEMESVIRDVFHYLVPAQKRDIEQTFFNIFNSSLKELEHDIQFFS